MKQTKINQEKLKKKQNPFYKMHFTKVSILNLFLFRIKQFGSVKLSIALIAKKLGIKSRRVNYILKELAGLSWHRGIPLLRVINHGVRSMKLNDYELHPDITASFLQGVMPVANQIKFRDKFEVALDNGYPRRIRKECAHNIYNEYNTKISEIREIVGALMESVFGRKRRVTWRDRLEDGYAAWGNAPSLAWYG